MIALSLYIPKLPTDFVRVRAKLPPDHPIVLSSVVCQRELVAACCGSAERCGVTAGMTLAQAKALLPLGIHHEAMDAALLARVVKRLTTRLVRFTPLVSPDGTDGVWLDIAGCTHLFGGLDFSLKCMAEFVNRLGFSCRMGVAATMGAAWALARYAPEPLSITRHREATVRLGPLPIEALRLEAGQVDTLHAVGIRTVAEMLAIPRAELAQRCGSSAVRRIDQALGREAETFTPLRTRPPLRMGQAFAGPTDQPETIALSVKRVLSAIADRLAKRGCGCRTLRVTLRRSDLPPVEMVARASKLTRDAAHWYTLLRPRLERAHLGFGVEGVEIGAEHVRTLKHEQATRWIDTPHADADADVARLADTLASRLGESSVVRLRPRASYIPERSWSVLRTSDAEPLTSRDDAEAPAHAVDRPTVILAKAVPIDAVSLLPDGPIGALFWAGKSRRIVNCRGPERIGCEWWRGDRGTRDYFQVQTDQGAWLWVYRALESGRWFLHGEWA